MESMVLLLILCDVASQLNAGGVSPGNRYGPANTELKFAFFFRLVVLMRISICGKRVSRVVRCVERGGSLVGGIGVGVRQRQYF